MQQSFQHNAFQFSGARIQDVTVGSGTIVVIAVDESRSVYNYCARLERMLSTIVQAARKDAAAEGTFVRVVAFGRDTVREIHGFRPLIDIPDLEYEGKIRPNGLTPLNDAVADAATSIGGYGQSLRSVGVINNAALFVITDGGENNSQKVRVATDLPAVLAGVRQGGHVESLVSVLIGVGPDGAHLTNYQTAAGIERFIAAGKATPETLARIGRFVSTTIVSQSQSVGSGGPSQPVSF